MDHRNIIDICSNYAWLVPLKDKKGITITNAFQNVLDESNRKRNKYGCINGADFTITRWNYGCRIMFEKFIQHIMKENLLLLKDLSEP